MAYCLRKELAAKLINAAKAGDVVGNIEALFNMPNSKARRDAFAKYVDQSEAKNINAAFEKAMVSNRKNAFEVWAKNTFTVQAKKDGHLRSALDKINEVEAEGLLTPEDVDLFMEDLVRERLGIPITESEAKALTEKTAKVEEAAKLPLTKYGPSVEFFQAKRELDKFIDSLTPTPKLKVATSVIGRATMLASFKSPIVNIESNTVNAISEALTRRIEGLTKIGIPVNEDARGYFKYANKIYFKTGYDVTRMYTMDDGKRRLGEDITHSQGPGKIRKLGRFYTDIVFEKLMTLPDVAFAAFHFTDSANIHSNAIARSEGLEGQKAKDRTSQLFLDSVQIEPKTEQGIKIREKARLEAERGTYTNKNNYSRIALMARRFLNETTGDLRLGDINMPFTQVPATVIGVSFDYSGVLLPLEVFASVKDALNAKNLGDPVTFKKIFDANLMRKITRAGLGITVAMILSSFFDPEDFIGEYPTSQKERELMRLENARENSIRIGKRWISLDYFGPLAAPFVGMMSAKKYGSNPLDKVMRFVLGAGAQATRIPGFEQFGDLLKTLKDLDPRRASFGDILDRSVNAFVDLIRSRSIPAIVSDIAKGFDEFERETDRFDVVGRLMRGIPGLRQKLPTKLNIFGEEIMGEGLISQLLFGSRKKTRQDSVLVDELARLAQQNQLPSITDVSKTSSRAKQLREQIGDEKFRKFFVDFGQSFKNKVLRAMKRSDYKRADDEGKKKIIEKIKADEFDRFLKRFGYRKPRPVKKVSAVQPESDEGNFLINLVSEAHSALVPDVMAAESLTKEDWEKAKLKPTPTLFQSIKNSLKKLFSEKFVSPEGEGKKKVSIKDVPPFTLQELEGGRFEITYPTGGTARVKNAQEKDRVLAEWQKIYPEMTGRAWPTDAPNFLEKKTPTRTPTKAPVKVKAVPSKLPDHPKLVKSSNFDSGIIKKWRGIDKTLVNTVIRHESGGRPKMVNINRRGVPSRDVNTRAELNALISKYGSVDIGLFQINNAPAMKAYLDRKGWDWFDLTDPTINMQVAFDLFNGDIPLTAGGWQNWHAIKNNKLEKFFGI